jgi:hypothetical protein
MLSAIAVWLRLLCAVPATATDEADALRLLLANERQLRDRNSMLRAPGADFTSLLQVYAGLVKAQEGAARKDRKKEPTGAPAAAAGGKAGHKTAPQQQQKPAASKPVSMPRCQAACIQQLHVVHQGITAGLQLPLQDAFWPCQIGCVETTIATSVVPCSRPCNKHAAFAHELAVQASIGGWWMVVCSCFCLLAHHHVTHPGNTTTCPYRVQGPSSRHQGVWSVIPRKSRCAHWVAMQATCSSWAWVTQWPQQQPCQQQQQQQVAAGRHRHRHHRPRSQQPPSRQLLQQLQLARQASGLRNRSTNSSNSSSSGRGRHQAARRKASGVTTAVRVAVACLLSWCPMPRAPCSPCGTPSSSWSRACSCPGKWVQKPYGWMPCWFVAEREVSPL